MATQAQVKAFIKQIAPIAQAKSKGRALPSVCIAQACCESAYGTSPKMIRANAVFGIKVGKSKAHFGTAWHDKAYNTRTKECYDGKTYTNITDMFRAYDSIEDAVEDYFDMLAACKRYRDCISERDPRKCITAIKNGGYATAPDYITTIMSIINMYDLTKYDGVATSQPTLRKGDRGESVKQLQSKLRDRGYTVAVDGIFGDKTHEAVKAYQADHGMTVDGVVGKKTWSALDK
jgi:flagellum-specific peptidoglycan hydrolase FlgJ